MAEKFVSERNLRFMLYEVFDVTSLTDYPYYAEHTSDTFDMILDTAIKIGRDMSKPVLEEMDCNQPVEPAPVETIIPLEDCDSRRSPWVMS